MKKILPAIIISLMSSFAYAKPASFHMTTTDGKSITAVETADGVKFKEFGNKGTILVFFGNKCPPCMKEVPELIKLQNKYSSKVGIVGIEVQGYTPAQLKAFKTQKNINYNLISGNKYDGFVSYIAQRAGWSGAIPLLIGIDKKGEVQVVQSGYIPESSLNTIVETITK
jgi:thiol-disulfide isomerase/thioredoxin